MEPGIIVIDMLKDFVWGSLKCDRAQRIVDPLRRLLDAARGAGIPVIFANDARVHQVGPESATRGPQATKTDGLADQLAARAIDELQPRVGDYHVPKHHYGAFHGTNLHSLLEDLGVDTVVLCGLHTNMCVASTAAEAFHHGYRIVVPTDGVEARTEEEHNAGMDHLTRSYGAELEIRVFTGVVLPENARMLNLLRDLQLPERLRYEDGAEYVEIELSPRT